MNTIPLSSNFFQASQAIKKAKDTPPKDTPSPGPLLPVSASMPSMPPTAHPYGPAFGYPFPTMMPNMMPNMNMMSPFMPWLSAAQPQAQPLAGTQADHNPPSSPPHADTGSLEHFYQSFQIAPDVQEGLKRLGFQIGDDLLQVSMEDVKEVGIKVLDWKRVLKHYREYKHHF